jgi:hypothetical protein
MAATDTILSRLRGTLLNDFKVSAVQMTDNAGVIDFVDSATGLVYNPVHMGSVESGVTGTHVSAKFWATTFEVDSSAANAITINNTGTGVIGIGSVSGTGAINIGTAATNRAITLGNTTNTSAFTIHSGTGAIDIGTSDSARSISMGTAATGVQTIVIGGAAANVITIGNTQTGGSLSLGAGMTTGTINVGGTGAQTGTINLGVGTGAQAINLGTGGSGIKTIGIGTGAVDNVITIGTLSGAAALTLRAGTVGADLQATGPVTVDSSGSTIGIGTDADTGAISIGTGGARTAITVGTAMTTGTTTIGGTAQTGTITLGSSSGTNIVDVGVGTGATTVNVATGVTNAKTVNIGTGAAMANDINIGGTGANTVAIANTQTGGSFAVGTAMTSGSISIGGTGANTGAFSLAPGTGAQTINIAASTGGKTVNIASGAGANAVTIGSLNTTSATTIQGGTGNIKLDAPTVTVTGDLVVQGTTTSVDSETVLIADNHLYLNQGYSTNVAQTGGLVVNYLPTATSTTVAAGGFTAGVPATSNPTVAVAASAGFTVGKFVQISGCADTGTGNPSNNGLFEVLSAPDAATIEIRGVGLTGVVEDFTQNNFTTKSGAGYTGAAVVAVNVSVMRASTGGSWEMGYGGTTALTFVPVASGSATAGADLVIEYAIAGGGGASQLSASNLPANAVPTAALVQINTAFSGGGVTNLQVGIDGGAANFCLTTGDIDITTPGIYMVDLVNTGAWGSIAKVEATFDAAPTLGAGIVRVYYAAPPNT